MRRASQYQMRLSPELNHQWMEWVNLQLKDHLTNISSDHTKKQLIKCIRALRTSKNSFEDDGSAHCVRLLEWIKNGAMSVQNESIAFLEKLSNQDTIDHLDIHKLTEFKNQLLDRFIPDYRPQNVQTIISKETFTLFDNIQTELDQLVKQKRTLGYLSVGDNYLNVLQHYPKSFRNTVSSYSSVLGATCQQTASESMYTTKILQEHGKRFSTVIIDEAARANPLDLLIPMIMGKKIILVGDHRQLPHLLEPEVEKNLEEKVNLKENQKQMLKISLFQRIKETLEKIEHPPEQPQRVVMLDKQFRMHSVLGEFISEQFYEKYGLPAIKSGFESDESFEHHIPGYEGKVCAWIDIKKSKGKQQRHENSFIRRSEAECIAKQTQSILASSSQLTLGIITFYRAQVDCIKEAMVNEQLTEYYKDGYRIKQKWKHRLHIGTVDAFQGKEFDVVLLSLVRTYQHYPTKDEQILRKIYGFLLLDNRLNVAMSRQHRLLIMVGDIEMAQPNIPEISAIYAFKKRCEGKYGKICESFSSLSNTDEFAKS